MDRARLTSPGIRRARVLLQRPVLANSAAGGWNFRTRLLCYIRIGSVMAAHDEEHICNATAYRVTGDIDPRVVAQANPEMAG